MVSAPSSRPDSSSLGHYLARRNWFYNWKCWWLNMGPSCMASMHFTHCRGLQSQAFGPLASLREIMLRPHPQASLLWLSPLSVQGIGTQHRIRKVPQHWTKRLCQPCLSPNQAVQAKQEAGGQCAKEGMGQKCPFCHWCHSSALNPSEASPKGPCR